MIMGHAKEGQLVIDLFVASEQKLFQRFCLAAPCCTVDFSVSFGIGVFCVAGREFDGLVLLVRV